MSIPRYYRKKLGITKEHLIGRSLEMSEKVVEYHRGHGRHPYDGVKESRKQADLNVNAKLNLRKKKL